MDIKELSNNAQIQVVLNIADLKELFLEWKEDNSRNANSEDEYMTADEVAIKYHVSKTTLWRDQMLLVLILFYFILFIYF